MVSQEPVRLLQLHSSSRDTVNPASVQRDAAKPAPQTLSLSPKRRASSGPPAVSRCHLPILRCCPLGTEVRSEPRRHGYRGVGEEGETDVGGQVTSHIPQQRKKHQQLLQAGCCGGPVVPAGIHAVLCPTSAPAAGGSLLVGRPRPSFLKGPGQWLQFSIELNHRTGSPQCPGGCAAFQTCSCSSMGHEDGRFAVPGAGHPACAAAGSLPVHPLVGDPRGAWWGSQPPG